jgi:hypothetical protein
VCRVQVGFHNVKSHHRSASLRHTYGCRTTQHASAYICLLRTALCMPCTSEPWLAVVLTALHMSYKQVAICCCQTGGHRHGDCSRANILSKLFIRLAAVSCKAGNGLQTVHLCLQLGLHRLCLCMCSACLGSQMFCYVMQAAGIADRLKARNIGFAISDAALDVVVKVRRDFSHSYSGLPNLSNFLPVRQIQTCLPLSTARVQRSVCCMLSTSATLCLESGT